MECISWQVSCVKLTSFQEFSRLFVMYRCISEHSTTVVVGTKWCWGPACFSGSPNRKASRPPHCSSSAGSLGSTRGGRTQTISVDAGSADSNLWFLCFFSTITEYQKCWWYWWYWWYGIQSWWKKWSCAKHVLLILTCLPSPTLGGFRWGFNALWLAHDTNSNKSSSLLDARRIFTRHPDTTPFLRRCFCKILVCCSLLKGDWCRKHVRPFCSLLKGDWRRKHVRPFCKEKV